MNLETIFKAVYSRHNLIKVRNEVYVIDLDECKL